MTQLARKTTAPLLALALAAALSIAAILAAPAPKAMAVEPIYPGCNMANALPMTLNCELEGDLNTVKSENGWSYKKHNYYVVNMPFSGTLTIKGNCDNGMYITIYDSSYNRVNWDCFYYSSNIGFAPVDYSRELPRGTYYIDAEQYTTNSGGYFSLSFKAVPKDVTIIGAKGKKKSVALSWGKLVSAQASGYQIMYSTKSNMKNAKTATVKVSKSSTTIKKLKAKTKYYFKIRSYCNANGKTFYGKWSGKKSVRTLK